MTRLEQLVARWRAFLARPFPVSQQRLPYVFVGVLALVTVGLIALDGSVPDPTPTQPTASTPAPSVVAPPVARPPAVLPVPSATALRDAKRAARRFTRGYVEYTYGRLDAHRIPAADPQLRNDLAGSPPRVPPAVARRHPHIDRVTVVDPAPDMVSFLAAVSDDSTIRVTAKPDGHGRWRVVTIG